MRRAAADLLARLPGSRLAATVERLGRPLVTSSGGFLRKGIAVTLPEPDPALDVATFAGKAPQGTGEKAWHLRWLLAHVQPERWPAWLGATPAELVERALRTDEARPVLEGWAGAATRFGDAAMVTALLADPQGTAATGTTPAALLAALPAADRARVADEVARHLDADALAAVVPAIPAPWPRDLADCVLAVLDGATGEAYPTASIYALARAAAAGLDPARADALEHAAAHNGTTRPALIDAIELVRFRSRLQLAFADLPPIATEVPR